MKTDSGWFVVFWEDEGVGGEVGPCNYCAQEKGGEGSVTLAQNEQEFLG